MLVTDRHRTRGRDLCEIVADAVRGGVGLVQVREPDLPGDELRRLVRDIAMLLPPGIPVLVNGRARVARQLGLGLHLPASAPPPPPPAVAGRLYGRSAHDAAETRRALDERVSYLVVGTLWDSGGKRGRGVEILHELAELAHGVPIFGIGGVTVARVPRAIHAGAHGVAVSGAILEENDPARMAQALSLALRVSAGG